jgi:hypothetical protein
LFVSAVYRQTEPQLRDLLETVRQGAADAAEHALPLLRMLRRPLCHCNGVVATHVFSHNTSVDRHNAGEFRTISGPTRLWIAKDSGDIRLLRGIQNAAPERVVLKVGAQVMLTRSAQCFDFETVDAAVNNQLPVGARSYCNGSRGVVVGFTPWRVGEAAAAWAAQDPSGYAPLMHFAEAVGEEHLGWPIVQFSDSNVVTVVSKVKWKIEKREQGQWCKCCSSDVISRCVSAHASLFVMSSQRRL